MKEIQAPIYLFLDFFSFERYLAHISSRRKPGVWGIQQKNFIFWKDIKLCLDTYKS